MSALAISLMPVDAPITVNPEIVDCLTMVADSAWATKDLTAAKRAYALVLDVNPSDTNALNRMGRIALIERNPEVAIDCFSTAFLIAPEPVTCINLAVAYGRSGDFTRALEYCAQAIVLDDHFLPAYVQQAAIYNELCRPGDAEDILRRALELFPDEPSLLFARSVHELGRGDFENGWRDYENRPDRLSLAAKLDEYPEWHEEPLFGKTILVCGEQGLGDQIMFSRYLPMLQAFGANVVLFTLPEVARLMAQSFTDVKALTADSQLASIEPDYWVAVGSLPGKRIFGGNISLFWQNPYLQPNPADVSRLGSRIPQTGNLRVGLCWKGNPKHMWDRYRSLAWEQMKPLLDVQGVDFYSLQMGGQESGLPSLVSYCHDFADTAAVVANLDLVITVDTAVAHLAGAIGKPVWILLGAPNDWRWGRESMETGWYPSAEIYRHHDIKAVKDGLTWGHGWRASCAPSLNASQQKHSASCEQGQADLVHATKSGPCRYGNMTWLQNDHYIGRALDLYGEYSESEAELLRRVLKPGDVVIEAGANVGGLTAAMLAAIGTTGTLVAYEPQWAYFKILHENCHRATVVHAALGSRRDSIPMRAVERERIHAPGWESTGEEFSATQYIIDGMKLRACNLIKIDVDGQEHEILKGAAETIARCRPLIYVEHDKPEKYPEMLHWLIERGYRLYQHSAPLFNPQNFAGNPVNVFGSMVSLMVLAVPNERKDLRPTEWGLSRIRPEVGA